ncbi:MAG: hypothetical protein LBQ54_09560 [Planctomycetaceae bacterium]|jgi:Tfp pilus assembly protein FimT|nr:hypothetical protein [Planctomycetaceae bacterium]
MKKSDRERNSARAFRLVEILAIIAVIGILISLNLFMMKFVLRSGGHYRYRNFISIRFSEVSSAAYSNAVAAGRPRRAVASSSLRSIRPPIGKIS